MSESDDEEPQCFYGTPLEAIDEESASKKRPIGVENQVVTDDCGRRRFHGAFTGGFSAGYFNTVGTMEGWLPNQFKSSRSKKSAKFEQKLEDFMDSEDMGEFGFAPKVIRTTEEFGSSNANDGNASCSSHSHGHEKRKRQLHLKGPIPGDPVLAEMLRSVKDTVGVRLLKNMGWKPGQGVGPRVTKLEKHKLRREKTKVYGCELPKELQKDLKNDSAAVSGSDSDTGSEYESITFAPDDYEPYLCNPKTNRWGIGYSGLEKSALNLFGNSDSTLTLAERKGKKLTITGQAFGVGAFEDEDEDIYGLHDMSSYDFVLEPEAEKRSKQKLVGESIEIGVLEGFQRGATSLLVLKRFLVPTLPNNYVPNFSRRRSKFEPLPESHPLHNYDRSKINAQVKLSADQRAKLLKEAEVVSCSNQTTESVQTAGSNIDTAKGQIENVSKAFEDDPEKQRRYELWSKAPNRKTFCLEAYQPFGMTRQERQQERLEFEETERRHQHLSSSSIDKKFVPAQESSTSLLSTTHSSKRSAIEEMRQAAQMKMFGNLTRQIFDWIPDPLLSKRFNIPEFRTIPTSGHKSGPRKPLAIFDYVDFVEERAKGGNDGLVEQSDENRNNTVLEPINSSQNNFTESFSKNKTHKAVILSTNDTQPHMDENRSSSAPVIGDEMIDRRANQDLYNLIFNEESSSEEENQDRDRDRRPDLDRNDSGSRDWSGKGAQVLVMTIGKEAEVSGLKTEQKEKALVETVGTTSKDSEIVHENKQIENFKKILLNESYNNRKLEKSQSSLPISSKKGILSNLDMSQIVVCDDVRTTTPRDTFRNASEQNEFTGKGDGTSEERKKPKKHKKHKKPKKRKQASNSSEKQSTKPKKSKKSKQLTNSNDDVTKKSKKSKKTKKAKKNKKNIPKLSP